MRTLAQIVGKLSFSELWKLTTGVLQSEDDSFSKNDDSWKE